MSAPDPQRAAPRGRPFLFAALLAAGLVAAWAILRPPAPRSFLLVTVDTLRADALDAEDMPALAEAAQRGMRFRKARTPAPLTLPAHATILTGVLPPVHGIRDNSAAPIPDAGARPYTLLAEDFRAAGYATAAFVASGVLDPRYRLDRGFDTYRHPPAPAPGAPSFPELSAEEQVARVREWFAARPKDRPFFVWVHLWDPHAPYRPYDGDGRHAGTDAGDPDALRYKGETRRVDAAIDALLGLVDERTTFVVVAADHGESLGEHGEATHGHLCHGATMDVPLVLLGPGVPERVVERVAGLEDIAPTLRRLCRLDAREGDGFDLLSLPEERVHAGESLQDYRLYRWAQQSVAFDGRFALIDGGPRVELYDRETDPHERSALGNASSEPAFERLDRALQRYRDRRGPLGTGTELPAAPVYYGIPFVPEGDFVPVAENRTLRDVPSSLPSAALLDRANTAIAAGGRELVRAFLGPLEALEREDAGNPAPCLVRGRALLLVLGDPPGAVAALEEAVRRGYDNADLDRLLEKAAAAAGDAGALERVRARIAEREKRRR
ncbi:MAG TPA: sulfatase [Planctomycetota bacterium]|nr:sulfatase [Planctomycetota bacterium]